MNEIKQVIQDTRAGVAEVLRNPKPKEEGPRKRIYCSVTPEELQAAKAAGLASSTYFKKMAFGYMEKKVVLPVAVEEKLDHLTMLLGGAANNLNQLAKHSNTFKKLTMFNLIKARENVHKMEDAIEFFFHNLSMHE